MTTDPLQTPDRDLPGQQHDQADLDIVIAPEPDTESARADDTTATPSDDPTDPGTTAQDPEIGNTLIRPENS